MTVKSTWLAVTRISQLGYKVSLWKAFALSIVSNLYEPRAKGNLFWNIYSRVHWNHKPGFILLLQRAGTNSFHLLRLYWSTSGNDLNSVTRNRCGSQIILPHLCWRMNPVFPKHHCSICSNSYMFPILKSDIVITQSNVTWFSIQHWSDLSRK